MRLGLPAVRGVVDRRILLIFRVEPSALSAALPDPFEPVTVGGWGIGGICLIRFENLRPSGLPAVLGLGSEHAAHRIAVEWERDGEGSTPPGETRHRGCSPRPAGPLLRLPPPRAVRRQGGRRPLRRDGDGGDGTVRVAGRVADSMPADSVFDSLGDRRLFPGGTVELDHALVMRDVAQEWREGEPLCVTG